jgi:hypothetical protein
VRKSPSFLTFPRTATGPENVLVVELHWRPWTCWAGLKRRYAGVFCRLINDYVGIRIIPMVAKGVRTSSHFSSGTACEQDGARGPCNFFFLPASPALTITGNDDGTHVRLICWFRARNFDSDHDQSGRIVTSPHPLDYSVCLTPGLRTCRPCSADRCIAVSSNRQTGYLLHSSSSRLPPEL